MADSAPTTTSSTTASLPTPEEMAARNAAQKELYRSIGDEASRETERLFRVYGAQSAFGGSMMKEGDTAQAGGFLGNLFKLLGLDKLGLGDLSLDKLGKG